MSSKEVHIYLATAGSGKTTTLLNLAKHHDLRRVAFITFTKVAAQVAVDRCNEMTGIPKNNLRHFSTLHSMCFRALGVNTDSMMSSDDYRDFGDRAGYKLGYAGASLTDLEEIDWNDLRDIHLLSIDSLYRNNPKAIQQHLEDLQGGKFGRFVPTYYRYRQEHSKLDYTDLLELYLARQLVEDVDVAFIDEAQDLTPLQWRVAMTAFRNCKVIYIAGDPNQALYSFAGGDPTILTRIRGELHYLDKSWRVPQVIMDKANSIVRHIPIKERADYFGVAANDRPGRIKVITSLKEVPYDLSKTYMMLAANRKQLKPYVDFCRREGWNYDRTGVPGISQQAILHPDRRSLEEQAFIDTLAKKGVTNLRQRNVNINTIHGTKGDEADVVIVTPDLQPNTYKHYLECPSDVHRMFYVAVTRTKRDLYILRPNKPKAYWELLAT